MKKGGFFFAALILLLLLCSAPSVHAEEPEGPGEWTVLIYMCGSDLESKYGLGTESLKEIAAVTKPKEAGEGTGSPEETAVRDRLRDAVGEVTKNISGLNEADFDRTDKVHVLIETGGAKAWHAESLGMKIRKDALQYWHFLAGTEEQESTFELEKEMPLASMANPKTLSDFIRWGVESHPAKKYALVLWGHGGGSATGIFIDELFGGEYMTLDKLNQALSEGGAHFEAVLFDACLMANLETACTIRDYASWMIASEELVAGKGSALGEWLQELFHVPKADGRLLGRWICDMAMIKYANSNDRQAQELMAWSVINLDKIGRLKENFDAFFAMMNVFYSQYPEMLTTFAHAVYYYQEFGTGNENMYDLAGIMYDPVLCNSANSAIQLVMQEALADAVDYCVHGTGRPHARGISFCLASSFQSDQLEIYSHNCPSPHYLALLDAISPWEAPAWVYEQAEKVPDTINERAYQITLEKRIWKNGSPALAVLEGEQMISAVEYNLYKLDEATGQKIRLGEAPLVYDADEEAFWTYDMLKWLSLDGNLCEVELQNKIKIGDYNLLYNIPMMVDTEIMNLRVAYYYKTAEWEVLGLWDGYNNDSSQFNRNTISLAQVAGREYNLLYEVQGEKPARPYVFGPAMTMYRAMKVEEVILPPGTYYIDFVIYDVFTRPMRLETVELEILEDYTIRIPDEPWEGTVTLDASAYYGDAE